jgi:cytochrome c oxidase subunit 3
MNAPPALDVGHLPAHAPGPRDPIWWGTALLIAIETTVFALLGVSYYYIRPNVDVWPPSGSAIGPTGLWAAGAGLALLAASCVPMALSERAAEREELGPTRAWLLVATLLGAAALAARYVEYRALPFRWDAHAYGSLFWTMLGFHSLHLLTAVVENAVFLVMFYAGRVEKKHFSDVDSTGLYWYFISGVLLPIDAVLYLENVVSRP